MNPRATAIEGLARGGEFIYFDQTRFPNEESITFIKPGDWLLLPVAPWRAKSPAGTALLTPAESIQIAENWVICTQNVKKSTPGPLAELSIQNAPPPSVPEDPVK